MTMVVLAFVFVFLSVFVWSERPDMSVMFEDSRSCRDQLLLLMHCDHQESTQSWSGKPRRGHRGAALPLILCQSGGGGGGRVTDNLTTVNHDNTPILWLVPTFLGKDHHW